MANKQHQPLDKIPEVETQDEQFQHLGRVDALVVEVHIAETVSAPHEDEAKEVDGREVRNGYDRVTDNHGLERIVCSALQRYVFSL